MLLLAPGVPPGAEVVSGSGTMGDNIALSPAGAHGGTGSGHLLQSGAGTCLLSASPWGFVWEFHSSGSVPGSLPIL